MVKQKTHLPRTESKSFQPPPAKYASSNLEICGNPSSCHIPVATILLVVFIAILTTCLNNSCTILLLWEITFPSHNRLIFSKLASYLATLPLLSLAIFFLILCKVFLLFSFKNLNYFFTIFILFILQIWFTPPIFCLALLL